MQELKKYLIKDLYNIVLEYTAPPISRFLKLKKDTSDIIKKELERMDNDDRPDFVSYSHNYFFQYHLEKIKKLAEQNRKKFEEHRFRCPCGIWTSFNRGKSHLNTKRHQSHFKKNEINFDRYNKPIYLRF